MKSFAIISALFAGAALAAPANDLAARQAPVPVVASGPAITEVVYRVSNLEDPANPKFVDTVTKVNGGAVNFDEDNDLVGACKTCLNTGGHVHATRIDIITALSAIHCNLYNGDKHVIQEFTNLRQGADFDGVENHPELVNKAISTDKYSLLCYYV